MAQQEQTPLPQPNKNSRKIAIILMILLFILAGLSSLSYIQQNQLASAKNQTISSYGQQISSQTAKIASLEASIAVQARLIAQEQSSIAQDNSTMSEEQSSISSLQSQNSAIANFQENESLVTNGEYAMTPGHSIQLGFPLAYSGAVVFAEAFVPNATSSTFPIEICSYQNTGNLGYTEMFSGTVCSPQIPYSSLGLTVYIGWFPAAAAEFNLGITNNMTSSGTLVLDASLLY